MSMDARAAKSCFVVMPIGKDGSEVRARSDKVLEYIIRPAIEPLGYSVTFRADQMDEPGIVSSQIIGQLIDADLVVADLSDLNANVFYELAVRHVVEKPIVHLIGEEDIERIPFDVNQVRAIRYGLDVAMAHDAQQRITSHVISWESGGSPVENPISRGIDVNRMTKSGDPIERALRELRSSFDDLAAGVRRALEYETPTPSAAGFTLRQKRLEGQFHDQAERVLAMQRRAIAAFVDDDLVAADAVIALDDEIDQFFVRILFGAQTLLAAAAANSGRQHELLALLDANMHVERIADSWVTAMKLTRLTHAGDRDAELVDVLSELFGKAETCVRVALECFETRDLEAAESLIHLDELFDRALRRFTLRAARLLQDPESLDWALRMTFLSRVVERVQNRAFDLGEVTAYMLTAQFRAFAAGAPSADTPIADA